MPDVVTDECLLVKSQVRGAGRNAVPFVSMAASDRLKPGTPLGERILHALAEEGRKVTPTEEELGISPGHLGRIIRGERWRDTIDPLLADRLAKKLHVRFEWLVLGEGPMRREGRDATVAEQAIRFAREAGCREDAIQAGWERNKDREPEMTVVDWVLVFNSEAQRLVGTPRPEHVREAQRAISRTKKRLEKAQEKGAIVDPDQTTTPAPRRAVNHR